MNLESLLLFIYVKHLCNFFPHNLEPALEVSEGFSCQKKTDSWTWKLWFFLTYQNIRQENCSAGWQRGAVWRSSHSSLYYLQTLSAETQTTQCIYRRTTVWFITLPRSVDYFHECGQPSNHKRNHITVIAICYLFSYVVHKRTVCIKNGTGWCSFNLCAHRQIGS